MGFNDDLEKIKKYREARQEYKNSVSPKARMWVNVCLLALSVLVWRGCFYEGNEDGYIKDANDKKIMAVYQAQEFIKKRLKAPSTADFQNAYQADVKDEGNNTYYVSSYVDAENSFSAKLRMNYQCRLYYTPDGMVEVKYINIDN